MKFLCVVQAIVRHQIRWAREHLYAVLILSPLVLSITYLTLTRLLSEAPEWQVPVELSHWLAVVCAVCLTGAGISRAGAELYHVRSPEAGLEALPVSPATHFNVAFLICMARTLPAGLVAIVIHALINTEPHYTAVLLPLAFFILLTSLAQLWAALNLVHWHSTKNHLLLPLTLLIILLTTVLTGLLLAVAVQPTMPLPFISRSRLLAGSLFWFVMLYFAALFVHQRWRASDIEHAARLSTRNRQSFLEERTLQRWLRLGSSVAAPLARDLRLTLRIFSSAVYVAAGLGVLCMLVLLVALTTNQLLPGATTSEVNFLSGTWLPAVLAVKLACVAATVSLGTLLPALVAHELPHFWLEGATGTTGREMYEVKLWYTRLICLPAALVAWTVGALGGRVEWFYTVPLLFECLWLWWLVSSLMGALAFEIPTRPGLAIILMITAAGAMGLLTALLWPLGLALYAYGMAQLTHRGYARAKYLLLTGGD